MSTIKGLFSKSSRARAKKEKDSKSIRSIDSNDYDKESKSKGKNIPPYLDARWYKKADGVDIDLESAAQMVDNADQFSKSNIFQNLKSSKNPPPSYQSFSNSLDPRLMNARDAEPLTNSNRDKYIVAYPFKSSNFKKLIDYRSSECHQIKEYEWLAAQVVSIYRNTREIWDIVDALIEPSQRVEFINAPTAPSKRSNNQLEDSDRTFIMHTNNGGKARKISPTEYITEAFTVCDKTLSDKTKFPERLKDRFPSNFKDICAVLMKFLINVLSHFYTRPVFIRLHEVDLHSQLNRIFAHSLLIVRNHKLKGVIDPEKFALSDLEPILND